MLLNFAKVLYLALLTLPVSIPDEERKLSEKFFFRLLCVTSKGSMKVLKVFIKPFEAPKRSVNLKAVEPRP